MNRESRVTNEPLSIVLGVGMVSTRNATRDLGLRRSLGLGAGIALAFGSVAGSGILFLPSLTYRIAGADALLVWAAATLLCFPLLLVFAEMVRRVPDGSGLEGFIALDLGRHVAATVPPLFLSLVCLGLPAGSLVAGGYLAHAVGGGGPVQLAGAGLAQLAATLSPPRMAVWAIIALTVAFAAVTCITAAAPQLVVELVLAASTVFMLLYVLALLSYLRTERRPARRLLAGALLAFMLALGAGAGWKALYPLAVFAAALGISLVRSRRRARGTARRPRRAGYRV